VHHTKISKWEGSLGSNLFQLANAIHLAKCIGSQVCFPALKSYNLAQLQLFTKEKSSFFSSLFSKKSKDSVRTINSLPYFEKKYHNINLSIDHDIESSFNAHDKRYADLQANSAVQKSLHSPRFRDICQNNILPMLNNCIQHTKHASDSYESTLVVHITTNKSKVIPPFAYIEKILGGSKYNKVIVCSAAPDINAVSNPLHAHLVAYCKNNAIVCDSQYRTLSHDLKIILNAKNVVMTADSRLIRIALLCSQKIQNINIPRLTNLFHDDIMMSTFTNDQSVNVHAYKFVNYYSQNEEWDIEHRDLRKKISIFSKDSVIVDSIS
jgi:hypothetical protein